MLRGRKPSPVFPTRKPIVVECHPLLAEKQPDFLLHAFIQSVFSEGARGNRSLASKERFPRIFIFIFLLGTSIAPGRGWE